MPFRRGFKSETNQMVRETRAELCLGAVEPLDSWYLADYLGVPVVAMTSLIDIPISAVRYFSHVDPSSFSAVTVFRGSRRLIVHNDSHVSGRQKSDVTHELSHALLLHPPTPAIDDRGCRVWNRNVEDEAEWLSGALLVPEEAALWIVHQRLSIPEAAAFYGVTNKLLEFRITITAARKRAARGEGKNIR